MKTIIAFTLAASMFFLAGCSSTPPPKAYKQTFSSFDLPSDHAPETLIPNGSINFQGVDVNQALQIYQGLSGRVVIHGPLPSTTINLRSPSPLSRVQALQMFDTVLAQNGITMVLSGENAVKAVPTGKLAGESPPNITLAWELLPDSSSYMSRTVQLQNVKAVEVVPLLSPLSKLPNSIIAIQDRNLLLLRDYSSNIRQQLQLLEQLEQSQKAK
jgi:general secretion pathway protein D